MGLKKKPEKENLPASTPMRVDNDDIAAQGVSQSGDLHGSGAMMGSFGANDQFGTTTGFNDTPMTSGEDLTRLHDPPITTSSINNTNVASQLLSPPEMHHDSTGYMGETNSDSVVNQDDDLQSFVKILLELDGRITGSKNDVQPVDAQFSSPKNIDKKLGTVGRGRIREPLQKRSRTKLSTQEIAGDISQLQSEAYARSSPAASGSGTSMRGPSESSLPFPQTEQTRRHDPSSANSGRSSAFVGQTSSTYNQMYLPPGFRAQDVAGQTPSFTNIAGNMPPGSIYSHIPMDNRGLLGQNHLAQIPPFYGNSVRNMSPQSSMAYGGGFAAFARGGSGPQAFQGVPFSSSIQPVGQQFSSGQVTPLPPIGISYNIQPVMRNQFPTTPIRFGMSQADLLGTQQSGGRYQQYQAPNVQHPMAFSSGQGIPSANVAVGIPRASNIHGRPPRGRRGLEGSLVGWSRVRPRSKPRPSAPPPALPMPTVIEQDSDSTPSLESTPSPDSTPLREYISSSLQPTGEQCWICKRDVAFTLDGPLSQPAMPPVVAILPCHHVFHAQCLENITPKEQAEDPPCIPCAIGEP